MGNIQTVDEEQLEMMKLAIGNITSGMCLYRADALRQTEVAEQIKNEVQKNCCILNMESLSKGEYPDEMGKLQALLHRCGDAQVVFLCNLQLCFKKLGKKFFENLNYMRDQMLAMNKVWIFGVSHYAASLFNRYARDLYSCIMNHFEFYSEMEERLARFEEIRYPDGDLVKADKKLQEYKKEFADTGLCEVQDSRKSDAVRLWNRLYRYCDADTKEWMRELIDKKDKQFWKKSFSFQYYTAGIELAKAWMHMEEYGRALVLVDFVKKETEGRLVSPGPELAEAESLKGEILFFMHRYQEAEKSVQKALYLISEMEKEYGLEVIYARDILAKIWSAQKKYGKAVGLYEKTIHDTINNFDEKCPFLVGLWNNLGAVYICMRQNERAADCFAKAADIWPKDAGGGILRGEELEKLGMLLEEEGDFPAAYKCISQAKDIRLNIEIDRRDEKHLQKLNERMSAYAARIKKIQEEKGRHGKKDIGYRGE